MMDLYEAIEVVEKLVETAKDYSWTAFFDDDIVEALTICLEAARDKAGV